MMKIIKEMKIKKEIKNTFNNLIDGVNKKAENAINQKISVTEIFIKHYGFDMIITLPYGYSYIKLRELIPSLEIAYKADVIIELSKSNVAYMRCHINGLPIKPLDDIKFKWYKHFHIKRNGFGETYKIQSVKNVVNPNDNQDIVGYRLIVKVPEGLSFDDLLKEEDNISKVISKCFITWDDNKSMANVEIMTKLLDNSFPFKVIKTKPYELYTAMTYSYKPVILDMKTSSNCLFSGINGSGKTVCMEQGLINLSKHYDVNTVQFYVSFISCKADLRILKDLRNTKFYGTTLEESLNCIKRLLKECERRNKLFEECEEFTVNIYEYNKTHPDNKLPFIYFISDEIIDFMPDSVDNKEIQHIKNMFNDSLIKLGRTSRSSGIFLVLSLQEARTTSIPASLKSQLNCMVCFYQVNSATGTTLLSGDGNGARLTKLNKANRECIIKYQNGMTLAKSLKCSGEDIMALTKNIKANNRIFIKSKQNTEENEEISQKSEEIKQKSNKKPSKWQNYQQNRKCRK